MKAENPIVVSMQAPLNFKVTANGFEKRDHQLHIFLLINSIDGQQHLPSKSYQISRSYNQLVDFSQQLKFSVNPEKNFSLPKLKPAKQFLSISLTSSSQKFEDVQLFLSQISRLPDQVLINPTSRDFFGIRDTDLTFNNERFSVDLSKLNASIKRPVIMQRSISDPVVNSETFSGGSNLKRSRSFTMKPLIAKAKLTRQRSVQPIRSNNRETILTKDIEKEIIAPWNLDKSQNSSSDNSAIKTPDDEEVGLESQITIGVMAPWNLNNLNLADIELLDKLKPITSKRKSRIQLGERGLRLKDLEIIMGSSLTIKENFIQVKVHLAKDNIFKFKVLKSSNFQQLLFKLQTKILATNALNAKDNNRYGSGFNLCHSKFLNYMLVYKLNNDKVYKVEDDVEFQQIFKLKPELISLAYINLNNAIVIK